MTWAFKACLVILLAVFLAEGSIAGESDSWFAKDKLEHFAVSTFYSAGAATVANRHFDWDKKQSLVVGFSVTISLGIAKEGLDARSPGETSSFKDLIWDLAGSLTGTLIAGLTL